MKAKLPNWLRVLLGWTNPAIERGSLHGGTGYSAPPPPANPPHRPRTPDGFDPATWCQAGRNGQRAEDLAELRAALDDVNIGWMEALGCIKFLMAAHNARKAQAKLRVERPHPYIGRLLCWAPGSSRVTDAGREDVSGQPIGLCVGVAPSRDGALLATVLLEDGRHQVTPLTHITLAPSEIGDTVTALSAFAATNRER